MTDNVYHAAGTVTMWHREEGWGVVALDESGLEVWVHFSAVVVDSPTGYRELIPGCAVLCDYETPGQDGYTARATRVVSSC